MRHKDVGVPKQVLVVDDIPSNRKLLRVTLELQGYAVLEAADGVEALAMLERGPIDVVISDILMPTMDGYRLCHEMRQIPRLRALPFIFYSSTYRSASDEKLALEMGGDKFLTKPAKTEEILAAIREVLATGHSRQRGELTVHGELGLMKQYSARLVSKLEEQNTELYHRTQALEYEITERERGDLALRESERRLSDLLANVELASLMLDRDARIIYCNDYLLRLTGWSREEVLGQDWFERFVPPEAAEVRGVFAALIENQPPAWHHVNPILTRTGERRVIQWNNTVLRSTAGDVIGTASIGEDISERLAAEEQLASAAQRMQALARRLVETRETEQRWLSAELHDRVGQNLTALGLNLDIVAGALPPEIAEKIEARLHDSRVLVDGVMASVRELIAELRPAALDDYGLLAGLRWFGEQIRGRTRLQLEIRGEEPEPRLDPQVEGALFRIAQEALNNTVKHAGARCATVELSPSAGAWVLTIADDGAGFDPAGPRKADANSHWGLEMMRERAEAVGARFRVDSSSNGTRIVVEVGRPQ